MDFKQDGRRGTMSPTCKDKSLAVRQMPEIGWIDALRRYNVGGTAWCIPRKGTPAYDQIMKIRKGEEVKTPKQLIDELEKKTGGKPKTPKKSMTINLGAK